MDERGKNKRTKLEEQTRQTASATGDSDNMNVDMKLSFMVKWENDVDMGDVTVSAVSDISNLHWAVLVYCREHIIGKQQELLTTNTKLYYKNDPLDFLEATDFIKETDFNAAISMYENRMLKFDVNKVGDKPLELDVGSAEVGNFFRDNLEGFSLFLIVASTCQDYNRHLTKPKLTKTKIRFEYAYDESRTFYIPREYEYFFLRASRYYHYFKQTSMKQFIVTGEPGSEKCALLYYCAYRFIQRGYPVMIQRKVNEAVRVLNGEVTCIDVDKAKQIAIDDPNTVIFLDLNKLFKDVEEMWIEDCRIKCYVFISDSADTLASCQRRPKLHYDIYFNSLSEKVSLAIARLYGLSTEDTANYFLRF